MAKKKVKEEQAQEEQAFFCVTCQKELGVHAEAIKHIQEVHALPPHSKFNKQMTMHMDGAKWYSSTYLLTSADKPEVVLQLCVRNQRTGADAAFWDADLP
jgi:hypothetical protein